ncbi:MAG: hypothetical protein FH748_14060 [Balneolaceae bacterium]|nr:hypothetical protein [Balneolaceae bacterium]
MYRKLPRIPRSLSNNEDPRNGLAFGKTHYWMFGQFMLTIRPDHTLLLSKWLKEEQNEAFMGFESERISLSRHPYYISPRDPVLAITALFIHIAPTREIAGLGPR